jgi:hypothetical protein
MVVLSDYFLRAASLNSELLKPEGVVVSWALTAEEVPILTYLSRT